MSAISPDTNIINRAACLNRAADYIELANEERAMALNMNETIKAIAFYALTAIGLAFLAGSLILLKATALGITSSTPYLIPAVVGFAFLQLTTVALVAYTLWSRYSHLACARNYELQAVNYNSKAADLPPWSGMGLISGFWSRLFSCGNPVTKFGSDTLAGRRDPYGGLLRRM